MSYLRTIGIATTVLLHAQASHAKPIDQDFKRCVSTALEQRGQTANTIFVKNGSLSQNELDHDASRQSNRYRMQVNSKSSGENLGTVTCTISGSGDLIAAAFDS